MPRAACLVACLLLSATVPQMAAAGGAELFDQHCSVCHNAGGIGNPGFAPPLNRPDFWQALGDRAPDYVSAVVTKGLRVPITVEGQRYAGVVMVPVAGASDEDLAIIASWVLGTLGETGMSVTADEIASMRASDVTGDDIRAIRQVAE